MAIYPIKMLKDESGQPFVPIIGANAIVYDDTETLQQKLDKKLEKDNIIAGDNITLQKAGNNITINSEIISSGSNSNGNWIKYSDGTMICYNKESISYTTQTWLTKTYIFPQTFIETPCVNISIGETGQRKFFANVGDPTTTQTNIYVYCDNASGSSYCYWIAIGRWK